ncbi:hypothetical protein TRFO_30510 [Tritrichomonas foetus]|uniref:Uncharacterized protein n=1 Tax=Tritrichomonas foetus TaxID=1144522 RepID=A0A1J4JTI9_9EUKA|nr:hypothetical protein TRFO_30510 [Tritrichomonas foetus]|eukprot:OHT02387.1 hypothetical protein TRFO_30510 [Tritrichomonas foetus]
MVNDFESTLKVTGPKADVDQFIVDYKVGKKTFMYMVEPYPKIYDLLDEYFLGNLDSDKLFTNQTYLSIPEEIRNPHQKGEIPFYKFDWTMNHSHWGTKFMCYNNSKERISDNEVIFSFCTASTPINLILEHYFTINIPHYHSHMVAKTKDGQKTTSNGVFWQLMNVIWNSKK